jgi:hypothetical protein
MFMLGIQVAAFDGSLSMNTVDGRIARVVDQRGLEGDVPLSLAGDGVAAPDEPIELGLRPENLEIGGESFDNARPAILELVETVDPDLFGAAIGPSTILTVRVNAETSGSEIERTHLCVAPGPLRTFGYDGNRICVTGWVL